MTPEQAAQALEYLAILPDVLTALRQLFAAVAVGTGFTIAGFIVLSMKH